MTETAADAAEGIQRLANDVTVARALLKSVASTASDAAASRDNPAQVAVPVPMPVKAPHQQANNSSSSSSSRNSSATTGGSTAVEAEARRRQRMAGRPHAATAAGAATSWGYSVPPEPPQGQLGQLGQMGHRQAAGQSMSLAPQQPPPQPQQQQQQQQQARRTRRKPRSQPRQQPTQLQAPPARRPLLPTAPTDGNNDRSTPENQFFESAKASIAEYEALRNSRGAARR